jgi:hypothetical protein
MNKCDNIPHGHAFQEKRIFHPDDMTLRRNGFRIFSRRGNREPVWWRDGRAWLQSEAMKSLNEIT